MSALFQRNSKTTQAAAEEIPLTNSNDTEIVETGNSLYPLDLEGQWLDEEEEEEIVLLRNIELSEAITIPAGKNIVLNLNGKTISQEKTCEESYSMITNKGTLKIKGNGTISFKDLSNGGGADWGSYVITNNGTLVVEGGTLKHFGSADGDHDTNLPIQNYKGKVTINGGTISSVDFRSLRDFTAGGEVIINGGKFEGQVWSARTEEQVNISKGTEVVIVRIEGVKAFVKPLHEYARSSY